MFHVVFAKKPEKYWKYLEEKEELVNKRDASFIDLNDESSFYNTYHMTRKKDVMFVILDEPNKQQKQIIDSISDSRKNNFQILKLYEDKEIIPEKSEEKYNKFNFIDF